MLYSLKDIVRAIIIYFMYSNKNTNSTKKCK